ncbi:MAG TPA: transposase [Candidatus Methanoperedens sp.]
MSLLTDHRVFAHKYRGKILTGDAAMITEGMICKTCKELDIGIIEIAVNPDHVHIFFKYPHLKQWCGEHMWTPSCFHGSVGNGWDVVSKYIETQDVHHAKNASYRP